MKYLTTSLAYLFALQLFATNPDTINLPIVKAVVYQEGAQVQHLDQVSLKAGQHTLEIIGLTADILENSLQISLGKDVMIESIALQSDVRTSPKDKKAIDDIRSKSELLADSIHLLETHVEIYQNEKKVIASNSTIKGNENLTAKEVQDYSDFYRRRMMEIESLILSLKYKKKVLLKRQIALQQTLAKINAQGESSQKKLAIAYSAKASQIVDAKLTYLINEAGWTPSYDIRVQSVNEPLEWVYKADVFQNSGIEWTDVKLALATGFPSANLTKPTLNNYYLTPHNFYVLPKKKRNQTKHSYVSGMVMDMYKEPLIGATILESGTSNGTISHIDGNFSLKLQNLKSTLDISYTGYDNKIHTPTDGENLIYLTERQLLDEVVTVGLGSKSKISADQMSTVSSQGSRRKTEYQVPLAIKKNVTQRLFEIEQPYTVASNAKAKKVNLLTYNIGSDYRYEIVPKVEEKAYLVAIVENWLQYEFLSGNINIYFDGIYQGNYFLDLEKEKEELVFSIGVDPNIKVTRTKKKDYDDGNFFGDKVTSKIAWDIEILNGHPYAAAFLISDQVPVSKSDRIKVDLKELSSGELDEDTGIVQWKTNISGKDKKDLSLIYHVTAKKSDKVMVE